MDRLQAPATAGQSQRLWSGFGFDRLHPALEGKRCPDGPDYDKGRLVASGGTDFSD